MALQSTPRSAPVLQQEATQQLWRDLKLHQTSDQSMENTYSMLNEPQIRQQRKEHSSRMTHNHPLTATKHFTHFPSFSYTELEYFESVNFIDQALKSSLIGYSQASILSNSLIICHKTRALDASLRGQKTFISANQDLKLQVDCQVKFMVNRFSSLKPTVYYVATKEKHIAGHLLLRLPGVKPSSQAPLVPVPNYKRTSAPPKVTAPVPCHVLDFPCPQLLNEENDETRCLPRALAATLTPNIAPITTAQKDLPGHSQSRYHWSLSENGDDEDVFEMQLGPKYPLAEPISRTITLTQTVMYDAADDPPENTKIQIGNPVDICEHRHLPTCKNPLMTSNRTSKYTSEYLSQDMLFDDVLKAWGGVKDCVSQPTLWTLEAKGSLCSKMSAVKTDGAMHLIVGLFSMVVALPIYNKQVRHYAVRKPLTRKRLRQFSPTIRF
ncbi:MAG: hypothetical protein MMC33_010223 [Icmadophila ericetorum]|nr:hypothetical protein [Icmadophila ericetorum]